MTLRIPPAASARAVEPPRPSMRNRMSLLIGDRLPLVLALVIASILSGFTEAATLALIAQVAAGLVKGAHRVHQHIGPFDIHTTLPTLIEFAAGFAILRLILQFPISILPARIAMRVQTKTRRKLFRAFTLASWETQSRDREGLLQETMTSQVTQSVQAAIQMTGLISSALTFTVLLVSAFLASSWSYPSPASGCCDRCADWATARRELSPARK